MMTFSPPIDPLLYILLNLHCLIGGIAATIAYRKGRKLTTWLVLGLIGGTVALVAALLLKSNKV
jgi:hypothetical protein